MKRVSGRLTLTVGLTVWSVVTPSGRAATMPAPRHHWVFDAAHVSRQTVKAVVGPSARLLGRRRLTTGNGPTALVFDGKSVSVLVTDRSSTAGLPVKDLTVEAWVAVEQPLTWGGIVGALRDNGRDETGWVLGYRDKRFSFALATTDKRSLTYLTAKSEYELGAWYHVIGTYDGREHRLYVNGRLAATDRSRHGPLLYPPTDTFYEIGAYHDTDEYFRLTGYIHEVAVYAEALTPAQVAARYHRKADNFPTVQPKPKPARAAVGPWVQFQAPGVASIEWETALPTPTALRYGPGDELERKVGDSKPKRFHRVVLRGLKPRTRYGYQVLMRRNGRTIPGRELTLDTTFNYTVQPLPPQPAAYPPTRLTKLCASAADTILAATGVTKGYCLVYGCGEGQLAYELAKRSELLVVGVDPDADSISRGRKRLQAAGAYGPRITLHPVDSLTALPFTGACFDLIVSQDLLETNTCPGSIAEVRRVLRPDGGTACFGRPGGGGSRATRAALHDWLGDPGSAAQWRMNREGVWVLVTRGPLSGAGRWTHEYGAPDNSSYGGESLSGVGSTHDLVVQWFGRPGADFGLDRNPRMPAPLAVHGRLFHQGMNRIIALNAYNGAVLWSMEIPDLRRVNMPRDAGNWSADDHRLYVAVRNRCWVLDAATGARLTTWQLPDPTWRTTHDWGYVAALGDMVLGSSVKEGASFTEFWGHPAWYDSATGPGAAKVCSDDLFAVDKGSGKRVWRYRNGVLLNSAIAAGGGRVYFVECRNPAVRNLHTGRVLSPNLWLNQHLVALDAKTGKRQWDHALDTADGTVVFYLAYRRENVVLVSSTRGKYHLYAFAAATGKPRWEAEHPWTGTNHSGHMQHPVLVDNRVYLEPCAYELTTGKRIRDRIGRREGCATYTGTDHALVYRGQGRRIAMWDSRTNRVSTWFNLRPSCWLSTIPALGMVLSPEGGGGCSCGNWLETSLGFLPRSIAEGGR